MEKLEIKTASLGYLKKLQSIEGDLEIARRVVENDGQTVNYFMGIFSRPMLEYIGEKIMKYEGVYLDGTLCYYPSVSTQYYEFIGKSFKNNVPTWHPVALYKGTRNKGDKDARLYSYINTITVRHFINQKKKEDKTKEKEKSESDLIENMDLCILKEYEGFDEIDLDLHTEEENELMRAFRMLPEREQIVLQLTVMDEENSLEVFEELIPYLDTEKNPHTFNRKQRQDAVSLLKGRAKMHLRKLIIKLRKEERL